MTELRLEFEINALPKTVNQIGRAHWRVKHKESQVWKRMVIEQCILARGYGLKLSKARLVLTRFSSRECDFDNLASSFKHVLDGLTEARVIIDDKPSVIGSPTFQWVKCKPKEGKINVKVYSDPQDNVCTILPFEKTRKV